MRSKEDDPAVPNTRERRALVALRSLPWEDVASLYPVGAGTVSKMIEKGWIEWVSDAPAGRKRVRITSAGIAALGTPIPPKPPGKPKLKMLKPRVGILDTRRVKTTK